MENIFSQETRTPRNPHRNPRPLSCENLVGMGNDKGGQGRGVASPASPRGHL